MTMASLSAKQSHTTFDLRLIHDMSGDEQKQVFDLTDNCIPVLSANRQGAPDSRTTRLGMNRNCWCLDKRAWPYRQHILSLEEISTYKGT